MKDMRYQIYEDFQKEFPLSSLEELSLEKYTNLNREDSFCYWVESKTHVLGSIWGGTSYKFGIYEYENKPDNSKVITEDERYAWYKRYGAKTSTEAYKTVLDSVVRIAKAAQNGDFKEIDKEDYAINGVYKWKIAFLYSNFQLIPIYKKEMLIKVAQIMRVEEPASKSISELHAELMKMKGEKDLFEFYDQLLSRLEDSSKDAVVETGQKYWIYAPGEGAHKWEEFYKSGIMGLGWDKLGDYKNYEDDQTLIDAIEQHYGGGGSHKNDKCAIIDFVNNIAVGDIIIVKKGLTKLIGRGVVMSEYYYDDTVERFKNRRKVKWTHRGEWNSDEKLVRKTLTDITKYKGYPQKLEAIMGIESAADDNLLPEESKPAGYWWLNANPKYWKMSEWKVGDVIEYTLYSDKGAKRRVFQNFLDAAEGDVVICYETTPVKKITTIARVSKSSDGETICFTKIKTLPEPIKLSLIREIPALQQMEFLVSPQGTFFKLTEDEYNTIIDIIREDNDDDKEILSYPVYTKNDFLQEVYMEEDKYDELSELLKVKKNIILQGAPGVGKTFCAERLAYSIMGKKDQSRIKAIQFHQNYSYEDFIMGYKPDGDSFKLRNGVFYNFCIEAINNPNEDYFFIIDEINRGNLSKIFGELLMIIEKGYRGKEITLAYSDQGFHVPENLYIIGMMNTADRSLALIDYALRRRFSFFDMKPGFDSDKFKAHIKASGSKLMDKVINIIVDLNTEICKDDSLGAGFEIGHSYFCDKPENVTDSFVKRVVKYDIIPTIQEYWFDNEKKATDWSNKLMSAIND